MCSPQYESELLNYLNSESSSERHFAFTLLQKIESPTSTKTAINAGLVSKDASIRQRALKFAIETNNVNLLERPMVSLLADSAATVRLEALHWLAEKQDCRDILEAAFFDSSFAVRLFARYRLREVDAKDIYMLNLQTKNHSLLLTLRGLIEIKAELPIETLEPFVLASSGKVRALTYELLLAQDKIADKGAIVCRALLDQSNHCIKSAHKYLDANPDSVAIETLWELFNQELPLAAKRTLISAMAKSSPWISLPYLLALTIKLGSQTKLEATLELAIYSALNHWLNKTNNIFTTPSTSSLKNLNSSLEEAKSVLKPQHYQTIKAVLKR